MERTARIKEIEKQLLEIEKEKTNLIAELNDLLHTKSTNIEILGKTVTAKVPESPEEKIDLFIKLFRSRENVFAKYWENKPKRIKGFSPVCKNEWINGVCNKPKIKFTDCSNQIFVKLNQDVVKAHLEGKITIGTYAIREDDTCIFLAADFDKTTWKDDAGRLHRNNVGKIDTHIYDYLDASMGLTISMFKKRLSAYREMGYKIEAPDSIKIKKLFKNL